MNDNAPHTETRLALDDGGGPRLLVSPQSFAEFDLWMSHELEVVERRWSHFATLRAGRAGMWELRVRRG